MARASFPSSLTPGADLNRLEAHNRPQGAIRPKAVPVDHTEIGFEQAIEDSLFHHGHRMGDPAHFDASLAMDAKTLIEFLRATQEDERRPLRAIYGAEAGNRLRHRTGALWQADSYDHIVRWLEQLSAYREYIALNPVLAHLELPPQALYRAEWMDAWLRA
jgi:hypothetical protein